MKKLEIKEEKFVESLVFMLMGLDKEECNVQTLFLVELLKECDPRGFLVVEEKRELVMGRTGIKKGYFDKMVFRLMYGGHVRLEYGIIYFAPKYMAVVGCEGNFLISCKKKEENAK